MKAELTFSILLGVLNVSEAFVPSSHIHLTTVRPTCQVAHLRFPRIPFLRKSAGESTVVEEPAVQTVEASTEVAPIESTALTVDMQIDKDLQPEKELSETDKLLKQVKEAGVAGVISYALWELGFWAVSVPVVLFGYYEVTGHWPDLTDQSDLAKLSAEAFAFVNFARFAVPLRIGLALSTTPWIQANVVDRFMKKDDAASPVNGTAE
jgi:hypothetical protein